MRFLVDTYFLMVVLFLDTSTDASVSGEMLALISLSQPSMTSAKVVQEPCNVRTNWSSGMNASFRNCSGLATSTPTLRNFSLWARIVFLSVVMKASHRPRIAYARCSTSSSLPRCSGTRRSSFEIRSRGNRRGATTLGFSSSML